jgi:hypothetical protein
MLLKCYFEASTIAWDVHYYDSLLYQPGIIGYNMWPTVSGDGNAQSFKDIDNMAVHNQINARSTRLFCESEDMLVEVGTISTQGTELYSYCEVFESNLECVRNRNVRNRKREGT